MRKKNSKKGWRSKAKREKKPKAPTRIQRTKNKQNGLTVIGLGNPGDEYSRTRHNVGFLTVELIARQNNLDFRQPFLRRVAFCKVSLDEGTLFLAKPLTYMNRSGTAVPYIGRKSGNPAASTLVICDTLDLPVGSIRLKKGGSSGGHNGINSIISETGESDFLRMYIGIGRPEHRTDVIDYVLGVPPENEQVLLETAIERAAQGTVALLTESSERVMNNLNAKKRQS